MGRLRYRLFFHRGIRGVCMLISHEVSRCLGLSSWISPFDLSKGQGGFIAGYIF